jgi:hypothetical protein
MIPPYSSNLNGVVLKIRKMVPRLVFSSRAISVRSFPAAYSCMTLWIPSMERQVISKLWP